MGATIRVGSANAGSAVRKRLAVDYRLTSRSEVLARVDRSVEIMERIVHKAGEAGCDVALLPEDTLGLSKWEAGNVAAHGVWNMFSTIKRDNLDGEALRTVCRC